MGERLSTREIIDRQQRGLVVGVVAVPEKWRFNADVTWNYANPSNPVTLSSKAENPANVEAVYGYPAARFFYLRPATSYYVPGQNYGGLVFAGPQPPLPVLVAFIRQTRAGAQKQGPAQLARGASDASHRQPARSGRESDLRARREAT
jgi:hypothetical protein